MNKNKFTKEVKCVVWDLDNTIWNGTLLESDKVNLKNEIKDIIIELDSRGIIHSISSKNNYDDAIAKLKEFELDQYFLFPEINFGAKSVAIKNIQKNLNIGIDTILFIDDQPFERDEVSTHLPEVETIDVNECMHILKYKRLCPRFITKDSKNRRLMYIEDMKRTREEQAYQGPKEEFLASLNMKFSISEAREEDLERVEELTIRTNQLNTTGITYSYNELRSFIHSDNYVLYVCELDDKYGSYGKIGLSLIEIKETCLHVKLLLMSCRVLSRGVGSVLLTYIILKAVHQNKRLMADFKKTDRNKLMYTTYRFANFKEILNDGNGNIVLENDLSFVQKFPSYIKVNYPEFTINK